jgi:HSP20 family protein
MALTMARPTDLFSTVFDNFFAPLMSERFGRLSWTLQAPPADVVETENDIRVMVELPGVRLEDIQVDLENNVLTVSGEKKEERREGDERDVWHLSERRYGRFSRSFVLPRDVEADKIEARYENGVLYLTIPKTEQARRRRIEIRSGAPQVTSGQAR